MPASGGSQGERAGQTEEEEEDDLRGASVLNNLLMGLPSISNFGCKVVRTVVTHVSSNRAKRDFNRGHIYYKELILQLMIIVFKLKVVAATAVCKRNIVSQNIQDSFLSGLKDSVVNIISSTLDGT